jgi:hypothetical protein
MQVTNQSDTWQDLTRVKPRVTSAEASAIGTLICQEHTATETPKSRYAILRCNHSRWIRMRSRPLISVIGESGIGNSIGVCMMTSKMPKPR